MAARQASGPLLTSPISPPLRRRSGCDGWLFWSFSDAAVVVCVLSCLLLLPTCNADKNQDLLQGLNDYRLNINESTLALNIGAQCLAEKLAASIKDQPCSNTSAQYSVSEENYPNYARSLQSCRIPVENVDDAEILPVCVNDASVDSALVFYTTTAQVEYQKYLNSTKYVSAGVGSAGPYFIVILGASIPSGNLTQTLDSGSPKGLPSMSFPFFATLVAYLVTSCLLTSV